MGAEYSIQSISLSGEGLGAKKFLLGCAGEETVVSAPGHGPSGETGRWLIDALLKGLDDLESVGPESSLELDKTST